MDRRGIEPIKGNRHLSGASMNLSSRDKEHLTEFMRSMGYKETDKDGKFVHRDLKLFIDFNSVSPYQVSDLLCRTLDRPDKFRNAVSLLIEQEFEEPMWYKWVRNINGIIVLCFMCTGIYTLFTETQPISLSIWLCGVPFFLFGTLIYLYDNFWSNS